MCGMCVHVVCVWHVCVCVCVCGVFVGSAPASFVCLLAQDLLMFLSVWVSCLSEVGMHLVPLCVCACGVCVCVCVWYVCVCGQCSRSCMLCPCHTIYLASTTLACTCDGHSLVVKLALCKKCEVKAGQAFVGPISNLDCVIEMCIGGACFSIEMCICSIHFAIDLASVVDL